MRIKVISRREQDYTREKPTDLIKVQRNVDPKLHHFEKPREYTRALNAVKLNKVFAKPFLGAMSGHRDGIYSMAKHPTNLTSLVSGACDGEIRVWNVTNKQTIAGWRAHKGFVRGLSISHLTGNEENEFILSCSEDKSIKMWHYPTQDYMSLYITNDQFQTPMPVVTYLGKYPFSGIDHQRKSSQFVTCSGPVLELWEHHHSEAVKTLKWNALTQSNNFDVETITTVKFNPIETHVLAAAATDRSILLYDVKSGTAIKRVILKMNTNALCWNPMETFNFTVANEDHNCYTFDARKLDAVLNVHKDHVSAVLDVDYSPTGKEFVSGSYDKTLRIFPVDEGRSREIYHTQRMQKIFCVKYSGDAHYVFSGSDDTNIRIWKSDASRQLGIQTPREMEKNEYSQKLIERYKHMPEIRRIHRKRHLPKVVYKIQKTKHIMNQSQKRKSDNVKANSRAGTVTSVPERKKSILKIVK